ncbi:MAG TPA: sulfotransferase [Streptosporangiaceae bacterium]
MEPPTPQVLYLGGLGRSGTTLLERLLGELPGAVSLGEVVHLWERGVVGGERCGCGAPFHGCAFWAKVGEVAFGGWDGVEIERLRALRADVDRIRHIPALARRRPPAATLAAVTAYVSYYTRLYRAAAEVSGAEVLIDSSKHASLAFCLRWAAAGGAADAAVPLGLRVLHVVRDSRGVAYSWTKQVRRPEAVAGGEEYMARWSPAKAAAHWNAENGAYALLGRRGVPTMLVRYEEFLRAPVAELRRIAEFASLAADDEALAFLTEAPDGAVTARLSANHTASGNPMRFQTGPVLLRRDDSWRTGLAPADRRRVTALTYPLLRRYGYLKGAPPA